MSALHRRIAVLMITAMVAGCSKAVDIPREDIDDVKYREPGSYRVRLEGRHEYLVKRFTVTDSTVVIEELLPADERFRLERASLPITLSSDEVQSVSTMRLNVWTTSAFFLGAGLVVAFFVALDQTEGGWGK